MEKFEEGINYPPNISTGKCCLYCWYGSWYFDENGDEKVKCNKYKVTMAIPQICDTFHDDETPPDGDKNE